MQQLNKLFREPILHFFVLGAGIFLWYGYAGDGALILAAVARPLVTRPPTWAAWMPAYGIGAVAAFWTIERLVGF